MARLTIISTIFIIAIVITASAYYLSADYSSKEPILKESSALSAKKEELLAAQLNTDNKIAELQQTVQKAIQEQEKLNSDVVKLQKDINTLGPSKGVDTTSTKTVYTPPTVVKPVVKTPVVNIPTPSPAPAPTPTTRAS